MKKHERKAPWLTSGSSDPMGFSYGSHEVLGRTLKKFYDKALDEPLPDRLVELMKQLKEAEDLKKKK